MFEVVDHVFLKVLPMKGLLRFGKKGKLSPRFVGPFEILERVGTVAYRIALLSKYVGMLDVFHVSILWKYQPDPTHVIRHELLSLEKDLTCEEKPIHIVEC